MEKKKVVVGMSGGVDSSVAAWLLKNQGYDVIGVTMQIWQDEEEAAMEEHGGCCGLSAVDDARRVAAALDIPYYVMNFKKEFKENVIDYFIDDYLHGRTPNPCIACNRYVKWESLLKRSLDIGAEYVATGHYARVEKLSNGRYAIRNSATAAKDQTYALYNLTQDQLSKTLMPVGEYTKDQINEALAAGSREAGYRIVPSRDLSGHGTEVLGIAAGNGQASGGQYRGVASKSDILVVKIGTAGSEFAGTVELMLALDYVIRKAMELGKPVAINLSFGNVYGSHVPYTRGILGLNRS